MRALIFSLCISTFIDVQETALLLHQATKAAWIKIHAVYSQIL